MEKENQKGWFRRHKFFTHFAVEILLAIFSSLTYFLRKKDKEIEKSLK